MINVDVQDSGESFARIHSMLRDVPGGVGKATRDVISRATTTARKVSLEGITSVYDIKAADVRDRKNTTINIVTRAVEGGVIGVIRYSGGKIPLIRFGVSHKQPKPGAMVKARQKKASPMTPFRNAFVANVKAGASDHHTGIFERKGEARLPITQIMGASTPQMVGDSVVLEDVEAAVMETIVKRTEQQITHILNGYGR